MTVWLRPVVLLVGLTLAGLALAGCTSGTGAGRLVASQHLGAPPAAELPSTGTASSLPPSLSPPSTVLASSSAVAPTSPASSQPASSAPSSPQAVTIRSTSAAPRSTCRSIMVRVIRGSADQGREFAALQFTNTGSTTCTLAGYPVVTLSLGGRVIGTPSKPAGIAKSRFDVAPGDTAESRLDDYTSCQAPLSDQIRVVVPGSTQAATRPGQLRACILRVSRLARPD